MIYSPILSKLSKLTATDSVIIKEIIYVIRHAPSHEANSRNTKGQDHISTTFNFNEKSQSSVKTCLNRTKQEPGQLTHFWIIFCFLEPRKESFSILPVRQQERSNMERLRQVCELNNKGVQLVMSGDNENAIVSFQNAVSLMKHAAVETDQSPKETNRAIQSGEVSDFLSIVHPANDTHQRAGIQQESGFVCDFPFLLQVGDDDIVDDLRVSLYSATLLFNLALGFHEQDRQGKGKEIQKALKLYHMTLQLLEEPLMYKSAAASVLAMVALNNKASCHVELCDYIPSQDCAAELAYMMDQDMRILHGTLPPEVVDSMIFNSTMILDYVPTAAQAA
jgi:hypothetical protein